MSILKFEFTRNKYSKLLWGNMQILRKQLLMLWLYIPNFVIHCLKSCIELLSLMHNKIPYFRASGFYFLRKKPNSL